MERIVRKAILILTIGTGISWCEPPPIPNSQYGVPSNFGASYSSHGESNNHVGSEEVTNSYGAPLNGEHQDAHQDYVDNQPKSYEFGYAVKDAVSGNDFGRRESSDGETVRGEYRVQLPDGRTQIVTYTADWRTGFHADVRYEGVASYPDQYNTNNNYNNNNNNNYNNNNNNNNNNHNNNINNNGNGYANNGGNGYNDLTTNTGFGNGVYNGGGIDHGYNSNNYNGINNNNNNNANYNNGGNNYNNGNSLDGNTGGYNYPGYSSNSFGTKAPVSSYGTPAFH